VDARFLSCLLEGHGEHPVSTGGGTWCPQACSDLKLTHHIHSPMRKASLNVRCRSSGTELNALMTIFHAKE